MLIITSSFSSPVLPDDAWIDFLDRLDYFSLVRCQRLNRSFRAAIARSSLAGLAFQDELTGSEQPQTSGPRPRPHPVFAAVEVWDEDVGAIIPTWRWDERRDAPALPRYLSDFAFTKELATWPPFTSAYIQLGFMELYDR